MPTYAYLVCIDNIKDPDGFTGFFAVADAASEQNLADALHFKATIEFPPFLGFGEPVIWIGPEEAYPDIVAYVQEKIKGRENWVSDMPLYPDGMEEEQERLYDMLDAIAEYDQLGPAWDEFESPIGDPGLAQLVKLEPSGGLSGRNCTRSFRSHSEFPNNGYGVNRNGNRQRFFVRRRNGSGRSHGFVVRCSYP